jgi:hypothetical protein
LGLFQISANQLDQCHQRYGSPSDPDVGEVGDPFRASVLKFCSDQWSSVLISGKNWFSDQRLSAQICGEKEAFSRAFAANPHFCS